MMNKKGTRNGTFRGVFVTGTDTEIGKTLVSGILAKCWRTRYWKPVQAGTEEETDSQRVARWIGAERIFPERYRLARPLSPNQAAAKEGLALRLEDFVLPTSPDPIVVEGAGGLLVPLNDRHLMIDLIERLRLPVVLVARSGLGTLNHSLMSIEILRGRGLEPLGVVLSGSLHADNRRDIEHFGKVTILAELPRLESIDPERFHDLFRQHFVSPPGIPRVTVNDLSSC